MVHAGASARHVPSLLLIKIQVRLESHAARATDELHSDLARNRRIIGRGGPARRRPRPDPACGAGPAGRKTVQTLGGPGRAPGTARGPARRRGPAPSASTAGSRRNRIFRPAGHLAGPRAAEHGAGVPSSRRGTAAPRRQSQQTPYTQNASQFPGGSEPVTRACRPAPPRPARRWTKPKKRTGRLGARRAPTARTAPRAAALLVLAPRRPADV